MVLSCERGMAQRHARFRENLEGWLEKRFRFLLAHAFPVTVRLLGYPELDNVGSFNAQSAPSR